MTDPRKPHESFPVEEAVGSPSGEANADVLAWRKRKIAEGLKAADEGRFASPDAVRAVIHKFIPNG